MKLALGATLGSYQIVGTLGAGGMGDGYPAPDSGLGRDVAITVLPSDSAGVTRVGFVSMQQDGRSYAYSYVRRLSQLCVSSGLK